MSSTQATPGVSMATTIAGKTASGVTRWRLRAGADKRFRSGHPWVYSNELSESPKGLEPGAPVELCDAGGQFLARGYGNPASLISFRSMSRDPKIEAPTEPSHIRRQLLAAKQVRIAAGMGEASYRLCFGEADRLPGLVIDRYRVVQPTEATVFVIQAHTAGMNRIVDMLPLILEELEAGAAIVVRNDVGVRKLEGLTEEEPRILREARGLDLTKPVTIVVYGGGKFTCNLLEGQKTGFFLDQTANVALAAQRVTHVMEASASRPNEKGHVRILDLCSYVGQWGSTLGETLKRRGLSVEVIAVDASAKALELAGRNAEMRGLKFEARRGDVLKDLAQLPDKLYDIVVADPPALIKSRKDVPVGAHAYLQLNTQVFRLVRPGGAVVSCSCSGLLEEERFLQTLSKAAHRNRVGVRWIARGTPSPDHPMLAEFPEGHYLKAWMGITDL